MDELGLLDAFLQRPHQKLRRDRRRGSATSTCSSADFRGLPERYAFIAFMPQWEFLDFIADEARDAAGLRPAHARRRSTGLIDEGDGRVAGVRGSAPDGRVRDPRRLHRRLRRPPLDGARRRRARRSRTSARRSTCSGSASRATRPRSTTALARIAPGHFVVTHRPRRLLAVRVRHRQGRRRGAAQRAASRRSAPRSSRPRRCSRRTSRDVALVGRRQAAHGARRPADAAGRSRACSASATRRTRCRRSAASASTSRSRTRSRRPICSRPSCATAASAPTTSTRCGARRLWPTRVDAGGAGRIQNNVLVPVLERRERRARGAAADARPRRACRRCSGVSRACSAWACGRSTSRSPVA